MGQIQGRVHGGQPPIGGSHVYILQTGTSGNAGPGIAASTANASTSLLTGTGYSDSVGGYVLTDSNGFFSVTGSYSCTAGTQVYAYVTGGNAGGGANANIGLMAILGACPSGGGDLSATVPYLWINEVTTVAAAYSMAGYATDATHVSTGGSALSATGIANAFATSANLVNIATGTALTVPANGNGVSPAPTVNSLANILASCVNATDASFANCTTLFGAAVGGTNATTPTDTATAAINMAHAPVTNVSTLYGLQAGVAAPFQTALTKAPNDLTVTITYTGGGLAKATYSDMPNAVSIDAAGDVWVANYTPAILSRFSPLGVPVTATGYTVGTGPFASAIDANGTVWTANFGGSSLSSVTQSGTVTASVKPTGIASPLNLAFDGSGNMFIGEATYLLKADATGTLIATSTSKPQGAYYMYGIAMEPGTTGGVWVGSGNSKYTAYFTNALASSALYTWGATADYTVGVAVDAQGNVWAGESNTTATNSVAKITTAGAATLYTPGRSGNYYIEEYSSVAVDGANTVWISDQDNGVLHHIDAVTGTILSGNVGLTTPGTTESTTKANVVLGAEPQSMAIDGAGNIWYNSNNYASLYEVVGAAAPTITPLVTATINSTIGTRP